MKKLFKKSLAVILIVIMTLTTAPLAKVDSIFTPEAQAKSISEYAVGDIIELGSYPQSMVTDYDLLSDLNSLSLDWISYGYYSGTGNWADGQMKPSDYMQYADVEHRGVKYRAVKFTKYRPGQTGGLADADSSTQDEKGYVINNVYWFTYEPIKWKILDPAQGLIMSDIILDAQAFNNTVYYDGVNYYSDTNCISRPNYYDTSSIRKWLNLDFINTAFSYSDSKLINGEVFLISTDEARNREYGFNPSRYDNTLQSKYSDYSVCQGLPAASNGYATWYFRSPGQAVCHATFVNEHGYIYIYNGVNSVLGIRPLMKLNSELEIPELESPTVPTSYFISDREFDKNLDYYAKNLNSTNYNPVLSNMMAALSKAVYTGDDIVSACRSLDFSDYAVYDYYGTYNPHTCGYALAFKKSDCSDDIICLVSVRGSQGLDYNADWIGNFEIATDDEKHIGFSYPANRIYENIRNYIKSNNITGTVKYFITGHSRGAAVANLLSIKLMENGVSASNIYDYNFACPDVACKVNFPSYNNIFNLCNREDVVPFIPGNICSAFTTPGTSWSKFGKTYWFTKDAPDTINPFADHDMDLYLEFFDQQLNPSEWGYSFADKLDDAVHFAIGWITKVFCPVDVAITDENGNMIASVINGEINYYDSQVGNVIIFTDGDKKIIYTNGDKNFNVILIGADNGEMTYSVEKYNVQAEKVIESKTFTNVKLEKDKLMFSSVNTTVPADDIELFVMGEDNGKIVITHTVDVNGNETESYWRNIKKIQISTPSTTTINYGETLVLTLENAEIPEGYSVEWYILLGSGVSAYKNETGTECRVTSIANGSATFAAVLVDENGKAVTDENGNEINAVITITSRAGFWQKLVSFFKNLFGINRIIY